MKRLQVSIIFFVLVCLISSCTGSREARSYKKSIDGNWLLETITTDGITGNTSAKLFNEASFKCFVGSSWNFVGNNGTGNYKINESSSECASTMRKFRWTIYEPDATTKQFQFKRIDEENNEMDNGDGFRMQIISVNGSQMQLKSVITFENKPAAYIYNFVKK